jgi:hypothetical protein
MNDTSTCGTVMSYETYMACKLLVRCNCHVNIGTVVSQCTDAQPILFSRLLATLHILITLSKAISSFNHNHKRLKLKESIFVLAYWSYNYCMHNQRKTVTEVRMYSQNHLKKHIY